MADKDTTNYILQISDSVTTRNCALRIDPQDAQLPWEDLLAKYLKDPPMEQLRREGRITAESAETLLAIQDLVYVSDDAGRLHDMFAGIIVKLGDRPLEPGAAADVGPGRVGETDVAVIDLVLDRWNVGYSRNWVGFHKSRWSKQESAYIDLVRATLEQEHGPSVAESILGSESAKDRLALLRTLANWVWQADFESYSRFAGQKLVFKSGDETVRNMMDGGGGICSEKVQALKFLTDNLGYDSEYLLAGPNARRSIPEERLRELLITFEFEYSKRYMRYWQHMALLYHLDGQEILVDATNGNIPFLFLSGDEANLLQDYPGKEPLTVRMSLNEEAFYYHKVSQDIPENLLFAMEGWIPEADLIQVFENELGLIITERFFVTAIPYKNQREFLDLERRYKVACEKVGLPCVVSEEWTLDSEIGRQFNQRHPFASRQVLASRQHLLSRYNDSEGSFHEAGLVLVGLENRRDVPTST